jgi:hypothetical protein
VLLTQEIYVLLLFPLIRPPHLAVSHLSVTDIN